jgi:hypothetical protein
MVGAKEKLHRVDFCVVGGGIAGMCAAISAARRGARVALVHDRPVLGGNASSEVRMHICGAHGPNKRESGIVEELKLENRARNPLGNYSVWDSILYEKVRFEPNITLILNASVCDLAMSGPRIASVKAWQLTSYTWHTVEARLFADCSGDSILAPPSGAHFRVGREAKREHDESIEPEIADARTMGMSTLIQARETEAPQAFTPPAWATRFETCEELPHRAHRIEGHQNYWWIELGGEQDSIHDTEEIRDELLKLAFGVWDHVKNRGEHGAERWVLDWLGFLPGKRESRRYVGDHVLTQNDVRAEGRFPDLVAYGGWSMDDHFPAGFRHPGEPTIFHPAPSPYGIPYRSLYSRNVENLLFAGRNISATHAALSSTRVMATCGVMGQAVGTAAAVAVAHSLTPRGVYEERLDQLRQWLMEDDCYLPFSRRPMSELTSRARLAASRGDPSVLRNGLDRPIGDDDNGFACPLGGFVEYALERPVRLASVRLVLDSDLSDEFAGRQPSYYSLAADQGKAPRVTPTPASMTKAFRIEAMGEGGNWETVADVASNHQRLVRVPVGRAARAVRYVPRETYGAPESHLFAFDLF